MSDLEGEVAVLHSAAQVEIAEALRFGAVVEQRARPHSASEHAQALRQVARHRPHALSVGATACRVEEVSLENVLVAACKRLLLLCLHGSQVHVGIKFADFLHHAALESLIPGHLVEWVHFISADGHDGGLTIDLANSVAESIELSNVFTFEACEVRLLESRSVATAVFGDDDVCVLAAEEHLHLLENLFQGEASCGQLTEDVVDISAPEEAALRAALLSLEVSADSDEVVVLKTSDLAPELSLLKAHRLLQHVKRKLNLESLVNVESDVSSGGQVLNLFL